VGNFYPKGTKSADFLREYARRLTTIEGNTTFYAVPAQKTIESWIEQTPQTFRFCPKIPKAISHNGKLADYIDRAQQFVDVMRPLASRLGPIFLQLPPSYSPRLWEDLKTFLEAWPRELRLGVEVRHLDWFDSPERERLNQLLADHNMARVVIDTRPIRNLAGDASIKGSVYESLLEARQRKPDVPVFQERTADFTFLRYIGHPQMEQNIPVVEEWVDHLSSQLSAGETRTEPARSDAFVFCHSPDNMIAPYLCREFHQQLANRIRIPPLPWDGIESDKLEQGRLF
jgi:uncharacterized protein YecE (DUF72 family)